MACIQKASLHLFSLLRPSFPGGPTHSSVGPTCTEREREGSNKGDRCHVSGFRDSSPLMVMIVSFRAAAAGCCLLLCRKKKGRVRTAAGVCTVQKGQAHTHLWFNLRVIYCRLAVETTGMRQWQCWSSCLLVLAVAGCPHVHYALQVLLPAEGAAAGLEGVAGF